MTTRRVVGITLETGAKLTLSGGITNNYIADSAFVSLDGTAMTALNFTGSDQISSLFLDGVAQVGGTWGSPTSGADHTSSFFTGTGMFAVVPEPGTIALVAVGLGAIFIFRRRSSAAV